MIDLKQLLQSENQPETFEEYLDRYANPVGDILNSYIPKGSHPDMDRYLYSPLLKFSRNGGKRHRPLICFAACMAVAATRSVQSARQLQSSISTRRLSSMTTSPTRPSCAAASRAFT